MYDTIPPAYVHVFQTVIPRNRLSRMFSMNQAGYSTLFSCVVFASLQFQRPWPLLNSPSQETAQNFEKCSWLHPQKPKKLYTYTGSLQKNHTAELEFTHKKNIRQKLIWHSLQVSLNNVSRRQQYKETLGSGYTISLTWTVHRSFESPLYFVVAIATTN